MKPCQELLKKFSVVLLSVISLSGCFLVSDIEILQKGQEVNIKNGEFFIQEIEMVKNDLSKLTTNLKEPRIEKLEVKKSGNIFSSSYEYRIGAGIMKFYKLDHNTFKKIYLVQLQNFEKIVSTEKREKDKTGYSYFHAKIEENGDVQIFPLMSENDNAENFFISQSVSISKIEDSKDQKMNMGIRKLSGDPNKILPILVKFASTTTPDLKVPLFSIKPLCKGAQSSWNNCIGRTVTPKDTEKFTQTDTKIGPYLAGKKNGRFFRVRVTKLKADGKEQVEDIEGNYDKDEFDGWWLYKERSGKFQRAALFEKGQHTRIHIRGDQYEEKGIVESVEKGKFGKLVSGWIKDGGVLRTGSWNPDGRLTEGTIETKAYKAVGRFSDHLDLGKQEFKKTKSEYVGRFSNGELETGVVKNLECENIGQFKNTKKRDGTTDTTNVKGMTKCKSGNITIGERSPLCESGWGGPSYVKFPNGDQFYGSTNATCSRYNKGVMIIKKTGKAYAVKTKSEKGGFNIIKEIDIGAVLRENGLN